MSRPRRTYLYWHCECGDRFEIIVGERGNLIMDRRKPITAAWAKRIEKERERGHHPPLQTV